MQTPKHTKSKKQTLLDCDHPIDIRSGGFESDLKYLTIKNDGQDIVSTNYWESQMAKQGNVLVSPSARCFRLLIPKDFENQIPDMVKNCDYAIVSTIKDISNVGFALEVLFEDHTKNPYQFVVPLAQVKPFIPRVEGQLMEGTLSIWIQGPFKVDEMKAFYREVPNLPWLKPLRC